MWDLHLNKSGIKSNKQRNKNQPCLLHSTKISESSNTRNKKGPRRHCPRDGTPRSPPSVSLPPTSFLGSESRVSAFAQNLRDQGASDFKPSICFHGNMLASPRSSSVSFQDSSCAHAGTCMHPECRHTPTPTGIPNSTASSLGHDSL